MQRFLTCIIVTAMFLAEGLVVVALMGWLTALEMNFLFGLQWSFWQGVVAWVVVFTIVCLPIAGSRS